MEITLDQTDEVLRKAKAKAQEIGVAVNIALLDTGGHLKSLQRMDDAFIGSIDIAIRKAKTAMLFRMPSEQLGEFLKPGSRSLWPRIYKWRPCRLCRWFADQAERQNCWLYRSLWRGNFPGCCNRYCGQRNLRKKINQQNYGKQNNSDYRSGFWIR